MPNNVTLILHSMTVMDILVIFSFLQQRQMSNHCFFVLINYRKSLPLKPFVQTSNNQLHHSTNKWNQNDSLN